MDTLMAVLHSSVQTLVAYLLAAIVPILIVLLLIAVVNIFQKLAEKTKSDLIKDLANVTKLAVSSYYQSTVSELKKDGSLSDEDKAKIKATVVEKIIKYLGQSKCKKLAKIFNTSTEDIVGDEIERTIYEAKAQNHKSE